MQNYIDKALQETRELIDAFLQDPLQSQNLKAIVELISNCLRNKNKVIIFGNGGSMCDAMHFAEELSGRFRKDRPALPAIAISDPAHLTCVANDYGFESVFSRAVEAFANPNDVVIGISTSGNSPNVIKAIHSAQELKCFTIALLGNMGGKLKDECDFEIIVAAKTSDRIQEVHGALIHIIIEGIERSLFPELYL